VPVKYKYKARDAGGKVVEGAIEGENQQEVLDNIRGMGYVPTQVTEAKAAARGLPILNRLFQRVSSYEMNMFYIRLSNLINAGISILDGLTVLARQAAKPRLKEAINKTAAAVKGGDSLSEAMAKSSDIFPELFVSMVEAGEVSGKLDEVLSRFVEFSEKQEEMKQKVLGALFYPIILLCGGLVVTLFLVTFVIPNLIQMFKNLEGGIPLPTLIMYTIGVVIKQYWYIILALAAAAVYMYGRVSKTPQGRLVIDRFKLNVPIFGALNRNIMISRFASTMGTLMESGIPILKALEVTKDVLGNEVLKRKMDEVYNAVKSGRGMAETLETSDEFPPDTIEMLAVGEEAGSLTYMLNKIADFANIYIDITTKKLSTVLEPLLIVFMGVIIGFVVASMLIPIFTIVNAIKV
jgi:type IV pilus assembly protein PilC